MADRLDNYRLLGRSGLRVSPLSLGTMTFRTGSDWGSSDAEAQAIYDAYVEAGGNFVDTANFYDRTPVEEILRAFDDLVHSGKVLYVGISDSPAWQISRMQAIAELRGWAPLVALQIPYNLTERTVERDLMPMAQEMGLGVLPWSPLAGGVLSGKYGRQDLKAKAPDTVAGMNSRKDINLATGRLTERTLDIAEVVKTVSGELGCTPSQAALA